MQVVEAILGVGLCAIYVRVTWRLGKYGWSYR